MDVLSPAPTLFQRLLQVVKDLRPRSNQSLSVGPTASTHPRPGTALCWRVTATLTREAVFGIVSVQSECHVTATSRTDALATVLHELAKSYPGYQCATIRADEGPGG